MKANEAFAGLHSAGSPDWYSPMYLIEAARWVMGGIDLDPASDARANQRVQATRFYGLVEDGLSPSNTWAGRLFINPPGRQTNEFWERLVGEDVEAIWLGFSLQQLQTLQSSKARWHPLDFPMCIPSERVAFAENARRRAERVEKLLAAGEAPGAGEHAQATARSIRAGKVPKSSPSHANYITYIGQNSARFVAGFSQFGVVRA